MTNIGTNTSDVIIEPAVGIPRTPLIGPPLKPQFQLLEY